jgi:ribonuclease HII
MIRKVTYRNNAKSRPSKDFFEHREWQNGDLVCGIDEVGRGCLAGPLVVAAVILFADNRLKSLKDSKILTKEELQTISPRIIKNSWYSFAIVDNNDIDQFNIYNATLIAMRQAVMNLFATCPRLPKTILIDALPLTLKNTAYEAIEIHNFTRGESLSRSIAAASIIAKVKRDDLMAKYDAVLPGYSFSQHKGYGTKIHQSALSSLGESILHRQSFLKKFSHLLAPEGPNYEPSSNKPVTDKQQSIFCRSD